MPYTTVLLDLDHTLFDFDGSEVLAFARMMELAAVENPDQYFAQYKAINTALWKAVELGEILATEVRHRRTEQLAAELGLDADPGALADEFVTGLGAHGEMYDGARATLDELVEVATLAMVTNGLGDVQRAKIERLDLARYFKAVVISGEVGASKPRPEIFELAWQSVGSPDKASVLMVGDSLSSDMAGGVGFGVDTCWYNPSRSRNRTGVQVTHEIDDLAQLASVVTLRGPAK